jgi:4a-hydroxytetrahydrobiopterin dehydratase
MAVTVLSCSEILCLVNNTSSLHLIPSAASKVWGRQKANMSLIRLSSGKKSKVGVKLKLVVRAAGGDPLGDFGARDPFPAEIESNFGDKVLGNPGTDHKILIPSGLALSLANKPCTPIPSGQPPMSRQEATTLLRKVVGWRIVEDDDGLRLQCLWKVKNFTAGIELMKRIAAVAEAAGHHPDLHLEAGNSVRARIWTHSIGGLSLNDFILAAKMDQINISDLIPRKRAWA